MGKAKNIVSGVAWTIVNNALGIVYGLLSVPFLINYFGKEQYGLIGIALSVNVYIHLLDMGMTNSNVRFFSEYIAKNDEERTQKLFNLTHLLYLCIGILNTLILFGLSFFVDTLFKVTQDQAIILRNLLWVLALNATFSWISTTYDQLLTADDFLPWIKRRSTFLRLMQFVILGATILFKLSIEVYFFGYVFIATVILPMTIVKAKKVLPNIRHTVGFDSQTFHTVMPYALSIFSFSIFQFCAFNFRPLFLGALSGPSAVAEFSIMNSIATVVTILSGSFMQVLLPIITKMKVNSDNDNIMRIMNDGTRYVTMLLSVVIFSLILSMKELITLYVGVEYTSLTKWIIIWLATLLLSHRNVMTSLVFTEYKIKTIAYMGAVAMIVAIVAYIVFIPQVGVGGVIIGFLIHEIIHTVFYYTYFVPKKLNINTWIILTRSVLPIIFISMVSLTSTYFLTYLLSLENMILVIIVKSAIFLISFGILSLLTIINKNDIRVISTLIKSKK